MNAKLSAILITAITVAGCSSSHNHSRTLNIERGDRIQFGRSEDQFPPGYHDRIVAVLRNRGFTVVEGGSFCPYVCSATLERGITTATAKLAVIGNNQRLVSIRAENHGWGTWVAPGAVKEDIIEKAIRMFDDELGALHMSAPHPQAPTAEAVHIEQLQQRLKELELQKKIKDLEAQLGDATNLNPPAVTSDPK
jgi:hypothetical protein